MAYIVPWGLCKLLERGLSDHCLAATSLGLLKQRRNKPFQYFSHLSSNPNFFDIVVEAWIDDVEGDPWFVLTSKLKKVKITLKSLNSKIGNMHLRVNNSREALLVYQKELLPSSSQDQFLEEKSLIEVYTDDLLKEESFLKQKSRINWLKYGDGNNKFFYNSCRGRWNINKTISLQTPLGILR